MGDALVAGRQRGALVGINPPGCARGQDAGCHAMRRRVLVAPGQTVRHLRDALAPQATAMVVGSMSKDYADHALSPLLAQWWLAPPAAVG